VAGAVPGWHTPLMGALNFLFPLFADQFIEPIQEQCDLIGALAFALHQKITIPFCMAQSVINSLRSGLPGAIRF
jgi:riboflavin transporter FmnP